MHQQQVTHDLALLESLLFVIEGDRRPIGIPRGLQDHWLGRVTCAEDNGERIEGSMRFSMRTWLIGFKTPSVLRGTSLAGNTPGDWVLDQGRA